MSLCGCVRVLVCVSTPFKKWVMWTQLDCLFNCPPCLTFPSSCSCYPPPSCAISNVTINKRAPLPLSSPSPSPQPCCIVLCWTKRALSWLWLGASLWQLSTKWNYIVNKLATLPVQCWKATATATTTGRTLFVSILISICRFQTSACELNVLTTSI